jgi:biotin carboxylase
MADAILSAPQVKGQAIHGVIAWTDPDVELAARLAACMRLPGLSSSAASIVRDKALARSRLATLGAVNPRYSLVAKEEEVRRAVEHAGSDCLIKPAGASGGRGIFRVKPGDDALEAFRAFRAYCVPERDPIYQTGTGRAVIEEYLIGSEHSVAGLVASGKIHIFGVTDKKVRTDLPYQFETAFPSALSAEKQRRMIEVSRAAVDLLGLDNTGFHVDMMLTDSGPKILEVGGRLGGECINSHLIPLALGIRPYELALQVATGQSGLTGAGERKELAQAAFHHLIPSKPGRIVGLRGLDAMASHRSVLAFSQVKKIGDVAHHPMERYNSFAVGYVLIRAAVGDDLGAVVDEVMSMVDIEVE